jgi:hypothetical protein
MYQKWVLKARIGLFVENVLIKLLFSDILYHTSTLPTLFWVQFVHGSRIHFWPQILPSAIVGLKGKGRQLQSSL